MMTTEKNNSWMFQVWAAFVLAVAGIIIGVSHLEIESNSKIFLSISILFSLSSIFSLAKTIRDNKRNQKDTNAWIFQVWASFVISICANIYIISKLNLSFWTESYFIINLLFLASSSFTLAKTIRDNEEKE